jgi:hypothetical protein
MIRRLVLILSAFSLLIGVMLVAVCVRAQWRSDSVSWESTDETANTWRELDVTSLKSGIYLHWTRINFDVPGKARGWVEHYRLGLRPEEDNQRYRAFVAGGSRLPDGFSKHESDPSHTYYRFGGRGSFFNRLGFDFRLRPMVHEGAEDGGDFIPSDGPRSYSYSYAHVPYWPLIPPFLIAGLPAVRAFITGRRRLRRQAAGCCPSCGYDIRATPERCPECGAVPEVRRVPLAARLLGRHAPAVHGYVSLLMATAIGFVFASMRHGKYETWTAVSLAVVFLGVLVKTLIGTVHEWDGRRAG